MSNIPVLSRLCDTSNCYKSATKVVNKQGKKCYVCEEHAQRTEKQKQGKLFT